MSSSQQSLTELIIENFLHIHYQGTFVNFTSLYCLSCTQTVENTTDIEPKLPAIVYLHTTEKFGTGMVIVGQGTAVIQNVPLHGSSYSSSP